MNKMAEEIFWQGFKDKMEKRGASFKPITWWKNVANKAGQWAETKANAYGIKHSRRFTPRELGDIKEIVRTGVQYGVPATIGITGLIAGLQQINRRRKINRDVNRINENY